MSDLSQVFPIPNIFTPVFPTLAAEFNIISTYARNALPSKNYSGGKK
jgi:hypothetical protein